MVHGIVIVFLVLATIFALVHAFAVTLSLYWYYWWFDVLMHLWGGVLLGLGIHTLSTFKWFRFQLTIVFLSSFLLVVTVGWEVFERFTGLYSPIGYIADTSQDLLLGIGGGLLTHFLLKTYRMK